MYTLPKLPWTLGTEASGTIVGLPTDEETLNNPAYKERKYAVGDKIAVVCSHYSSRLIARTYGLTIA